MVPTANLVLLLRTVEQLTQKVRLVGIFAKKFTTEYFGDLRPVVFFERYDRAFCMFMYFWFEVFDLIF